MMIKIIVYLIGFSLLLINLPLNNDQNENDIYKNDYKVINLPNSSLLFSSFLYNLSSDERKSNWGKIGEKLSNGDLVFRAGREMVSRLIMSQGKSTQFSHVGIIIKNNEDLFVVHALPNENSNENNNNSKISGGVLIESLASFASLKNASHIGFYRVKEINANEQNKIKEYALKQLGKSFDNDFIFSNDNQLYCKLEYYKYRPSIDY